MLTQKLTLHRVHRLLILVLIVALIAPVFAIRTNAAEGDELTMWTWKQSHVPALEALAKQYKEKTGVSVNIEVFNPDDAYRSKIQTSAQSGDLPDVIAYWSGYQDSQWELAAGGTLLELTDDIKKDQISTFLPGTFTKNSVWTQAKADQCAKDPNCTKSTLKVGQVFSVPFTAGSFYIVYANRKMLKDAGVDADMIPKDTTEFLEVMKKVHDKTGKGLTIGGKFGDILRNWVVNGLAISNCGPKKYSDMINGAAEVSFTDKCAADAFQFVGDVTDADLWQPGFQQLTIDQADTAFAKGEAAFDVGGSFTLSFLLQQGMKAEDILSFALPPLPTSLEKPINLAPFSLIELAVTKDSKHADEAKAFALWLVGADQMAQFAKMSGDLPAVKISSDPDVVGEVMSKLVVSYANSDKALQASPDYLPVANNEVWAAMDDAANKLVTNEGTLDEGLKAADEIARSDRVNRGE